MLAKTAHTPDNNDRTAIVRIKTLRLPDNVSDETTRRARLKGVPDAHYYRLLIERGLLLESVEIAMEKPLPPAYWGLCEAVLETRNILWSLAAAREHSTIPKAQRCSPKTSSSG